MNTRDALGRVIVATREEIPAENLSEYLAFSGIDAVLCRSEDGKSFFIAVNDDDEERAKKLIAEYESKYSGSSKKRASSPAFYAALGKLGEISDSAYFFIVCGLFVFVLSIFRVFNIFNHPQISLTFSIVGLVLGAFFTFFGIRIYVKSRQAKKAFAEENAFTLKVVAWFLGTYSAADLDKVIDADEADGLAPSEQRRNIIRVYISREFAIDEEDYLSYLTEEVYTALYHTRKLGGRK